MNIGDKIDNYTIIDKLGKGHFSKCWLVVSENGTNYALKVANKNKTKHTKEEIDILSKIEKHNNVINLIKVLDYNVPAFIMPNMHFNLLDLLEKKYDDGMPMDLVKNISKQTLLGLQHIYNLGIIHTDLKLENILIKIENNDINVKICDFGTSITFDEDDITSVGTLEYQAPENIIEAPLTSAIDIWAFGCILFEIITGDFLFDPHSFLNEVIYTSETPSNSRETDFNSENEDLSENEELSESDSENEDLSESEDLSENEDDSDSESEDLSESEDEIDDNSLDHMHLCLIEGMIGKMPIYIQRKGNFTSEYFHRAGILRNKPTFIKDIDLRNKLSYDYGLTNLDDLMEVFESIFVYNPDKRPTAEELLQFKFFN